MKMSALNAPRPWPCLLLLVFFATCARATVTNIAWYRLGENDPGAAAGQVVNSTTKDVIGSNDLKAFGSPVYSGSLAADARTLGSTLAVAFNGVNGGNQFYSNAVATTARNNFGIEAWARIATTNAGTYVI